MAREKIRIRFRKGGDLRLVSHHDLMRCFERMLRRAAIPFHSTEGFNPKPRMVFALSLGLGIVGRAEVVDLELEEPVAAEEVWQRLRSQAPQGLEILSVQRTESKGAPQVRRVRYEVPVPGEREAEVVRGLATVLAQTECWVTRTRPRERRLDVRPYIAGLELSGGRLRMDLTVTPDGTARPEEVLQLLGLDGLLDQGAVLERTLLEFEEESRGTPVNP